MFGYITINKEQLSAANQKKYQSFYCGLCQKLKAVASFKGQLLINYDLTFLYIVLCSLYEDSQNSYEFRCMYHPHKKKLAIDSKIGDYTAAMNILLSYHKLYDNYADEHSHISHALAHSLKSNYEEMAQKYPLQAAAICKYIELLTAAEKNHETDIDIVSNYTGECLSKIFSYKDDVWNKELETLGFYLGKFIYIMDAYEDLAVDEKRQAYNPLIKLKNDNPDAFETFIKSHLTSIMEQAAKAFERLPIIENEDIMRNILYCGVWNKYEYLQIKRKNKREKQDV